MPPDEESGADEDEEDNGGSKETNWLEMWALCVSVGISDSEWQNLTIPKIRALMKVKNKQQEFEIVLHGGEIKNKKPKKAKYLSDLGFFPK
ncbi:hypothetical protein OB236_38315 [Paenibacillus sp. WQ 127069]|uniref:Uncharacterized protein n=2 Tax=Paenibacillus baimaensis TaxID=2982185 RepID=A0ABT2UVF7_9BACL|nr:hypothetical protein [Paenibacillus sp. WQ 127069]